MKSNANSNEKVTLYSLRFALLAILTLFVAIIAGLSVLLYGQPDSLWIWNPVVTLRVENFDDNEELIRIARDRVSMRFGGTASSWTLVDYGPVEVFGYNPALDRRDPGKVLVRLESQAKGMITSRFMKRPDGYVDVTMGAPK